jgi:hypothetical protein
MPIQLFTFVAGLYYLIFGILGFFPFLIYPAPARPEFQQLALINFGYGYLLNFLPTNVLHNIVYVLIGVVGILAALFYELSRLYSRALFASAALAVILGVCPFTINQVFGLMPLFQWNIPTHTITAALAWYFGFIYPITPRPAPAI